jgi:hypothetical protein
MLLYLLCACGVEASWRENPLINFDKILFVRRNTYSSNHYYTEHINSRWMPGGNLCTFDVKNGKVDALVPELENGVFGRFDLDFDAGHIIFAWKRSHDDGYRIYEIAIDPNTGARVGELKQVTFPPEDEAALVERYRRGYHHGTDDMDPCYLPDGGIVFISTRCQYGVLCDGPDIFTSTVIYRMDRDGKNMQRLSNNSVSENAPSIMPDGRILYTRWEYVDKGAVSVKCLWAMKADGTASVEIYGADIAFPPTMMYGRAIPGTDNQYVMLGAPHCPQNSVGTVIRLDMNKPIRTQEPMTYMTPNVDIRTEGGFHFKQGDGWRGDGSGRAGALFREPYPLSDKFFLVSHKAAGLQWSDSKAYDLALLDENGNVSVIYDDTEMSCFAAYPLRTRRRPPVARSPINSKMAKQGLATCIVTDVYHGMENTERGSIKYIRVLEHVPRPWAARRNWGGDCVAQQHAAVSKGTHHAVKIQYGIVPVEEDGSAHFVVPADKNIFFHVLDENFMAVQKERTFVNYRPGETRACIGCHETPNDAATAKTKGVMKALTRSASVPGPQPGDKSARRVIDYVVDVQPVLDTHCVSCHGGKKTEKGLNLTGKMTAVFSVSYESLLKKKYMPFIGENYPKTGNVHYLPTRSLGSHNSLLVAMLAPDKVTLLGAQGKRAAELAEVHKKIKLSREELLKITNWVDTNGQFYGMYWGRKHIQHKAHPNFRPTPTFEWAASRVSPLPEDKR